MSTTNQFIGRREYVGIGVETTPGTGVPAVIWMRWLTNSLINKTTVIENESAMGVVDRVNDSEIVEKWSEGNLQGKVTSETIGFLLLGLFGSVSDGAVAGGVYPHTFTVNQSGIPKTLSFIRSNPLQVQQHAFGTVDSLEITADAGGWVEVNAGVKARVGTTTTATPAFNPELEFTSKNITLRTAVNVAGLTAAADIKASHVQISLERASEAFHPLGTSDVPEFDNGVFNAKGEFTVRMTDDQYETDFLANTVKAMYILIANGTTSLKFTASKVRYRDLAVTRDKDKIVTATIQFFAEYDTATSASIACVLTNARVTYP